MLQVQVLKSLKNLVLPGIGAFTILDSQTLSVSDLDSNFFVTSDRVGMSRAACTTQLLCELNTEVRSSNCTELLDTILDTSPQFFSKFTVVTATDISEENLKCLAKILWMKFFYAYRLPLDVNAIIHLDTQTYHGNHSHTIVFPPQMSAFTLNWLKHFQ